MIILCCPYVPKEGLRGKTQNGRFRRKNALRLKKVTVFYKVYMCEKCQRQSCKAFIGLTIRAKMIGGASPSTEILGQPAAVGAKSPIERF